MDIALQMRTNSHIVAALKEIVVEQQHHSWRKLRRSSHSAVASMLALSALLALLSMFMLRNYDMIVVYVMVVLDFLLFIVFLACAHVASSSCSGELGLRELTW
ncbi:unnamed protein product [Sphenostylis stenocarpa]|uniref:Uncharacterized protein n=1 Tax=Sphenostylis stenocarpa TaxID=92480 RepID=A0AA86SDG7_9FABA|nr:unnamed protein product [Sphenostylis stenocarpa]